MACSVEVVGLAVAAGAAASLGGQKVALRMARRRDGQEPPREG